jgi:hypothetical protein
LRLTGHKIFTPNAAEESYVKSSLRTPVPENARGLFMSGKGTSFYRPDGGNTAEPPPSSTWNGYATPGLTPVTPATDEERALADMSPDARARYETAQLRALPREMLQPEIINVGGREVLRRGPNSFGLVPPVKAEKAITPEEVKTEKEIAQKRLNAAHSALTAARKDFATDSKNIQKSVAVADAQSDVDAAEEALRSAGRAFSPASVPPRIEAADNAKIASKAAYDALPKGAIFVGSDGKRYKKP